MTHTCKSTLLTFPEYIYSRMTPNARGGVSTRGISLQDDSNMSPYNSL